MKTYTPTPRMGCRGSLAPIIRELCEAPAGTAIQINGVKRQALANAVCRIWPQYNTRLTVRKTSDGAGFVVTREG